ncbi:MAG: hypothetical protein ABJC12_06495 [Saprospiraceae bacterium]
MRKSNFLFLACIIGIYIFLPSILSGQGKIYLKNPSFEDKPRAGGQYSPPIKDWYDCGLQRFPEETPPDIHPVSSYAWQVSLKPYDGNTYLGLVVRYSATYESVSQKLDYPMAVGKCYSMSIFLARSNQYLSGTPRSNTTLENFTQPAILRIWGGNTFCEQVELMAESEPVVNTEWKQYDFQFHPSKYYTYITLEAYYTDSTKVAYNGHVLVDNCSPITVVECK